MPVVGRILLINLGAFVGLLVIQRLAVWFGLQPELRSVAPRAQRLTRAAASMRDFPPQRIVCLTEEAVETLYLLGEEDRIVGVSGYAVGLSASAREAASFGFHFGGHP